MTLFDFVVIYAEQGKIETVDIQHRYVVAKTEEEAREKLKAYNKRMVADGFMAFTTGKCVVDTENVIV